MQTNKNTCVERIEKPVIAYLGVIFFPVPFCFSDFQKCITIYPTSGECNILKTEDIKKKSFDWFFQQMTTGLILKPQTGSLLKGQKGTDKKVNKKQFLQEKSSKPKSICIKLKTKSDHRWDCFRTSRSQRWAQRDFTGIAVFPWNLTPCEPHATVQLTCCVILNKLNSLVELQLPHLWGQRETAPQPVVLMRMKGDPL